MTKYKTSEQSREDEDVLTKHNNYGGMATPSSGGVTPMGTGTSSQGMPKMIYLLTVLSAIGGFLFGYDTGVVSGAMLLIRDKFQLTDAWHEAIVSATIGAAWIFALIGGYLTDKMGRKPVIILASIVFAGGSVVMGAANSKEVLLIGRIIVGIGIGLASMSVPLFIAEASPPDVRGRLVTLNNIFITGGQFVSSVLCGAFASLDEGWRYMLGLAGIPAVIQLVGLLWMPESPRWLIAHGRIEDARLVLRKLRGGDWDTIDEELDSIRTACEEDRACQEEDGSSSKCCSTLWRVLQYPATRRALLLGCLLQLYQQISGINTVMYYSASIIRMAGVSSNYMAIWLSAAVASVNFLCTFVGLYLVEKMGRRMLTLGSQTGVVLALAFLGIGFQVSYLDFPHVQLPSQQPPCSTASTCAECISDTSCGFCYQSIASGAVNGSCLLVSPSSPDDGSSFGNCHEPVAPWTWAYGWCPSHYSWMPIAGMGIYLFFFAPGMGCMPWTINSEIYPLWARSTCTSIATSTCWMFNLIVSMTFLTLISVLNQFGAFYLYTCLAASGLVVLFLLLPETKGRSLEEMEGLFAQRWCCPWAVYPPPTPRGSSQQVLNRSAVQLQDGEVHIRKSVEASNGTGHELSDTKLELKP